MTDTEYKREMNALEEERKNLPSGSISKKTISGKDYYYLRSYVGGKLKEKYIPFSDLENVRKEIEKREAVDREISKLKKAETESPVFLTDVVTGENLVTLTLPVSGFRKREIYRSLEEYIHRDVCDRVFTLYGLRRSGKTTLMRQLIESMNEGEKEKTAYIKIRETDTLSSLSRDMKKLQGLGFRYILIDEVTLLEDFIEGAAVLSDIFASSGIRIILSGTDSLGFILSEDDELYDRTITLHTTFIPYREFETVLGIRGVDEYIRYGGTMCPGGTDYNSQSPFQNTEAADKYVNSAIASNIQHSLAFYRNGTHFRSLYELYRKNELTSAVNRVIEDINHSFTEEVLTRDFRSSDLSISRNNLRKDPSLPVDLMDPADISSVTERLKEMLEIRNRDEQTVRLDDAAASEIEEYLKLLDLIEYVDVVSVGETRRKSKRVLISQPGLRYAQAEALVKSLLSDQYFESLDWDTRNYVTNRILSEIKGRMLEDIVLLETKLSRPDREVFVLRFAVGEFDMVVFDSTNGGCDLYEIKHSTERNAKQYRHLTDEEKLRITRHFYGNIKSRSVLYRGETTNDGDIAYINVEEYLKALPSVQPVTYL